MKNILSFTKSYLNPQSHTDSFMISIVVLMLVLFVLSCGGADRSLQQPEELIRSGMPLEAANHLEKLIAANERNPKAHALLGQAYEALGRYDEAIAQLKTAINLYTAQPEDRAMVRLELAKIYLKLGEREAGFNELRAIVRSTSDAAVLREIAGWAGDAYQVVQLTQGDSDNYSPAFSPDGSLIAFSSYRLDNGEIYLMDLNGRVRQRVTFTTDFNESAPVFLSDPLYLMYSSEPKSSREVKVTLQSSGSTLIYAGFNVTHIYSKVTQELLPIGFGVRSPGASPERKRVVYESNSEGHLEVYMLDLSAIDLERIEASAIQPKRITQTKSDDGSPTFFPDGKRIVFVSSRDGLHRIYTMNLDGTDEKPLSPNRYDCYSPVVSPNGKTIAFVSARDGDIEIYMMDADGSHERRITNGIGVSMQPAFSPDGTKLAFVSDRSNTFQLYLMDLTRLVTQKELIQRLQRE